MHESKAFVPTTITTVSNQASATIISVTIGVVMLSLLAQLKIVLPWTPIPITGQTFGVALLALLWGSRLSVTTFASYLGLGFLGAPIFAGGLSGLLIGPTLGYLIGMLVASMVVGRLSDRGWGSHFLKALAACYIGSIIIFTCGIIGLSFFLPINKLFMAGVLPFLIGDFLKNITAAATTSKFRFKS